MIESAIERFIVSDQRFSSLASTRLYPVLLPNDSPLPAATYHVVAINPLYDLNNRVDVTSMRLQIDCWAKRYGEARNLMAAIVSILDNYSGPLTGGIGIFGIQLRNATDSFEHEALMYRRLIEFNIQFSEFSQP